MRKIIENADSKSATSQTLKFYAAKSGIQFLTDTMQHTFARFLEGTKSARSRIKQEIIILSIDKEQYQHGITSTIINRKSPHPANSVYLSDKLQRNDLIDRILKNMDAALARRNLFTMLKFDIKGFIDRDSINRNALARVDITIDGIVTPLTTKDENEDHYLLKGNPQAYWDSGTAHCGHIDLG
jgi:hypothetical protein